MRVELLWWDGCPSYDDALQQLRDLLGEEGADPGAVELREITSDDQAEHERFPGSPTIRIDGRDAIAAAGGEPVGLSCRVYRLRDGRSSPTPDPDDLREAIRRAHAHDR